MTGGLFPLLNPRVHWEGQMVWFGLGTTARDLFGRATEAETSVQPSNSTWSCPGSYPLGLAILSLFTCILTCFPEWKITKEESWQAVEAAQNKKSVHGRMLQNRIILLYICHSRKTAKSGSLL